MREQLDASSPSTSSSTPAPPSSKPRRPTTTPPTRRPSAARRTANAQTDAEDEIRLTDSPKVIIIGGGPNRIGQGIEFDYCCVQAAFAMKELGFESVMINSNPETVSTDYDTSDLLFFEPLTHEDMLNICERLNGEPFERSNRSAGSANRVCQRRDRPVRRPDAAEPRARPEGSRRADHRHDRRIPRRRRRPRAVPRRCSRSSASSSPPTASPATSRRPARSPSEIGYPVLVRPSFVLGGRAMEIVSDEDQLNYYMANAVEASTIGDAPISSTSSWTTRRKWMSIASRISIRAEPKCRRTGDAIIIGVMEHIEEAGIHSGDSRLLAAALFAVERDRRRAEAPDAASSPRRCACAA